MPCLCSDVQNWALVAELDRNRVEHACVWHLIWSVQSWNVGRRAVAEKGKLKVLIAWCRALPEALVSPLADNALIKTIPLEHFPRDLFMIGRSLMILRGLTHTLGMDIKVSNASKLAAFI